MRAAFANLQVNRQSQLDVEKFLQFGKSTFALYQVDEKALQCIVDSGVCHQASQRVSRVSGCWTALNFLHRTHLIQLRKGQLSLSHLGINQPRNVLFPR